ncbi:MAG: tRNA (adenosine(37)-N6)-threonylcarbamoyltransferase complex dimerization subunit type 1 TsaB [Gammaproteobacteria bacterium]
MKLLALDTATEACSAALWLDGAITERYEVIGRGHAERLLPMVEELLSGAGLSLRALDAIAFGRGPGGFTGLRIAAAIAQGLAAGAVIPVVPVSDLAALAAAGARASGQTRILACLDARMGQVYWAAFECEDGLPRAAGTESLAGPAAIELPAGARWFGAGQGFAAYPELGARLADRLCGVEPALLPRAGDIALLAVQEFAAGRTVAAARAVPTYLRDDVVHQRPRRGLS